MLKNKIVNLIKNHSFAIVIAVILGAFLIFPFFYFQVKLGEDFKGIFPETEGESDSDFYYARIRDVADGHPTLGNAYLWEHKNELPQQFLAEFILAQPIKLFGVGITTARLIYNFLLPAIAFLLTYAAFYLILRKRSWSLAFSGSLFFGLYLTSFIRPVSPQFNFIFWLTQFIFLWLLINNANNDKELRMPLIANVVNFGLLFYIYPYYWTFYLIFLALLTAIYFFNNRALSYKILSIAGGGLILAIPYFYLNYLSSKLPYYMETLTRLGMIYTHFPSYAAIVRWSVLVFIIFYLATRKKFLTSDVKTSFFASGILTGIVAINQNVITGRNLEFISHYEMGIIFFLMLAMAYLLSQISLNPAGIKGVKLIILAILLAITLPGLKDYWLRISVVDANAIYIQKYAPIFTWLNSNTAPDSVVYADARLSNLIPVYAANNVFYHRNANYFFISDQEVLDRFIINNFFEKFDDEFVVKNDYSIFGVRFSEAYRYAAQGRRFWLLLGLRPGPEVYLPEEEITKVMNRAKELQRSSFTSELKRYRVDYLIWDKAKNSNWRVDAKEFIPAFQSGDLAIFRVR